jgi:hypothetical protein
VSHVASSHRVFVISRIGSENRTHGRSHGGSTGRRPTASCSSSKTSTKGSPWRRMAEDQGVRGRSLARVARIRLTNRLRRSFRRPLWGHPDVAEFTRRWVSTFLSMKSRHLNRFGRTTRASEVGDRPPRDPGTSRGSLRQDETEARGIFTHRPTGRWRTRFDTADAKELRGARAGRRGSHGH